MGKHTRETWQKLLFKSDWLIGMLFQDQQGCWYKVKTRSPQTTPNHPEHLRNHIAVPWQTNNTLATTLNTLTTKESRVQCL